MERRLSHVVEEAEQELLGITLLSNHEFIATANFIKQFNSDGFDLKAVVFTLVQDPSDVGLEDTERTIFIRVCEGLLDHCGTVDLGLWVQRVVVLSLGVDD